MTTRRKVAACLLLVLGILLAAVLRVIAEEHELDSGAEYHGTTPAVDAPPTQWDMQDADRRRQGVKPIKEPPAPKPTVAPKTPPTQVVQVMDASTGRPISAATVLHTAPGSYWEDLDAAGRERYSMDTEQFLREVGESKTTDANGIVQLPLEAAQRIVVGRRGDLYGSGLDRNQEGPWILTLDVHRQLTVEVYNGLNLPVAGVLVLAEDRSMNNPFGMQRRLGTTDKDGVVTHMFKEPETGGAAETLFVFASLPGGPHGEFAVDPASPPVDPVRIVLPAVGTVTLLVLDPTGVPLDGDALGDPNIELVVAGPESSRRAVAPVTPFRVRQIARIGSEGLARFDNVALGETLSIRAPTLFKEPIEFHGPRMEERDVLVEQRMHIDHPILAGRLHDTNGQPMRDIEFQIMCRAQGDLVSMVAGDTDMEGDFRTYLSARALGTRPDELIFYMGWKDMAPSRAVLAPIAGTLLSVVQVGIVVIPD